MIGGKKELFATRGGESFRIVLGGKRSLEGAMVHDPCSTSWEGKRGEDMCASLGISAYPLQRSIREGNSSSRTIMEAVCIMLKENRG